MIDAVNFYYAWKMYRERCASGHADPKFRRKPMGSAGFIQASIVWNQWSVFCTARNVAWFNAKEVHVESYLQSITARRRPRVVGTDGRARVSTDRIKTDSRVTIRRYWRVLNDFYAFGMTEHYVSYNPALVLKPEDGEDAQSVVLSVAEYYRSMAMLPEGTGVKSSRNRLTLLLVARHALTTAELVNLKLSDALILPCPNFGAAGGDGPETLDDLSPVLYEIALKGDRSTQVRTIVLDDTTSRAMRQWLKMRPRGSSESLLLGHHGKRWTPKDVHYLCSEHLEKCQISLERRTGSNTLRNSCILNWLNDKMPLQEIERRCGFKDKAFLRRLACHIRPPIADAYGCKTAYVTPISIVDQGAENQEFLDAPPVPFRTIKRSVAADAGKLIEELSAVWDGTPAQAKELSAKLRRGGLQQSGAPA